MELILINLNRGRALKNQAVATWDHRNNLSICVKTEYKKQDVLKLR